MADSMLADPITEPAGVEQYAEKAEWVEEKGPRGGRRWRRADGSGKPVYKDPTGKRSREKTADAGGKQPGWQRLEEILNKPTMQDEPPEFARDTKLPGAGKDPDDVGFGVPDLPKEPAAVEHAEFPGNTDGFQKAKSQQLRQLANYIQHALPLMLPKMSKDDVQAWAAKRGLDGPMLNRIARKDVAKHLAQKAVGMANAMDAMRQERAQYQPQEVAKIEQRIKLAEAKPPAVEAGGAQFKPDLIPDDPEEIKQQSTSIANVLGEMSFGQEVDAAIDDLANQSLDNLTDKYGAMGLLIAGAGLAGGVVGGAVGGAVGSIPLLAMLGGGTAIGISSGLDPISSIVANTAVTGYLLARPKRTPIEAQDEWEKANPELADTDVPPPDFWASIDQSAAGWIPKSSTVGAKAGSSIAMMPFVGLSRLIRKLTGPSEVDRARSWKEKIMGEERAMRGYARQEPISAMQLKQLSQEFMEDYLGDFGDSMAEYLTDNPPGEGQLAEPIPG